MEVFSFLHNHSPSILIFCKKTRKSRILTSVDFVCTIKQSNKCNFAKQMKIRIGYIIKKYREAHNYDQASLGRLAGISRGKVVYIENDKSTQKEDQLEKLANAMGSTWLDMVIATALPKWMDAGKEPHLVDEHGKIIPSVLLEILKNSINSQSREAILLAELSKIRESGKIVININIDDNGSNNSR